MSVMNTTGTSRSASTRRSASTSMSPLNGWREDGTSASGTGRSSASAPVNSTFARVVSKWVLFGIVLPGAAEHAEQDLLGRPALVGRDHVLEREQLLHGVAEAEPGRGARVALVTALKARPLLRGHRARARVREQVHEHARARHVEQVVARALELLLALLARGHPNRLDGVDPERLDDRAKSVHSGICTAYPWPMSPVLTAPVEAPPSPPERPGYFAVAWATFLGYLFTVILALPLVLAAHVRRGRFVRHHQIRSAGAPSTCTTPGVGPPRRVSGCSPWDSLR